MSMLADFDFVLELSNTALLNLIKGNLQIQGTSANPPFEVTVPVSDEGIASNGHIIVDEMLLDMNPDDTITLTLLFSNSSIHATSPLELMISTLDGNIEITAPLQLVAGPSINEQILNLDLATAAVGVNFSQNAQNEINTSLAGTLIPPQTVHNLISQAIQTFVNGVGSVPFPLGFRIAPGEEGTLSPKLQFERLEAHCIPNATRAKQTLGLFGILILANHAKGNHSLKAETAIPAGRDVAICISPETCHKKMLCPGLAKKLLPDDYKQDPATATAKLPTTCGTLGSIAYKDAKVTSITSSFAQGHIDLRGTVKKSGFCYEAEGNFHAVVTLSTDGTQLKPQVKVEEPDVDVDIPWYCWLATLGVGAAIGGVVGAIAGIIAMAIVDAIVNAIADSIFGASAFNSLQPAATSIGNISGASFNTTSTTPEGLVIGGLLYITLPAAATRSIVIEGAVTTSKSKDLGSGTFHADQLCALGEFPYTEKSQNEVGTYHAAPTLLGRPLDLTWEISAGNWGPLSVSSESARYALVGTKGTATIPNVETDLPFPLPNGTRVTQDVHIGYEIAGDGIMLTNVPYESNYYFWLHVRAQDPLGHICVATEQGRFQGHAVNIGNDFDRKVADCLAYINAKMNEKAFRARKPLTRFGMIPGSQIGHTELLEHIESILRSEVPEADAILSYARLIHGPAYHSACASVEATREVLGLANVTLEFSRQ
jgi:hypothetical protein